MASTTDVILSFLGDLDNEPDFFFPDLDADTDAFIGGFSNHGSSASLKHNAHSFSFVPGSEMLSSYDDEDSYSAGYMGSSSENVFSNTSSSDSEGASSDDMASDSEVATPVVVKKSAPMTKEKATKSSTKLKKKKKKLSVEEKVVALVAILRKMRGNLKPDQQQQKQVSPPPSPPSQPVRELGSYERTIDEAYDSAEYFLKNMLACNGSCQPADLANYIEMTASLHVPALSSLFSLAQSRRSENKLSAWAPASKAVEQFPERHSGVGQIAGASRSFTRIVADLVTERGLRSAEVSVKVKRSTVSFGNQLIAPFVWKCTRTDGARDVEFSGLIRCTFGQSKISFVHVSFDAFTIIRQCE